MVHKNKNSNKAHLILASILIMQLMSQNISAMTNSPQTNRTRGIIYFISCNDPEFNCDCLLKSSSSMETTLNLLLSLKKNEMRHIKVIKYDISFDKGMAEMIMKKYEPGIAPAVILVNTNDKVCFTKTYHFGIFNIPKLARVIDKLIKDGCR